MHQYALSFGLQDTPFFFYFSAGDGPDRVSFYHGKAINTCRVIMFVSAWDTREVDTLAFVR